MIAYRVNAALALPDIIRVFKASGIARPTDDPARIERMFQEADLTVSAWDGETLVGLARALTDFAYCCYLSDLAVDASYQKQGIGKQIVETLRSELGDAVTLILVSAPAATAYYPRVGFEKSETAYLIRRKR
jgi:predicted N-acetyltransferase YhbS